MAEILEFVCARTPGLISPYDLPAILQEGRNPELAMVQEHRLNFGESVAVARPKTAHQLFCSEKKAELASLNSEGSVPFEAVRMAWREYKKSNGDSGGEFAEAAAHESLKHHLTLEAKLLFHSAPTPELSDETSIAEARGWSQSRAARGRGGGRGSGPGRGKGG